MEAGRDDAAESGEVGVDFCVGEAGVEEQLADDGALSGVQFQCNEAAGFQQSGGVFEDESDDGESVCAGEQCVGRFVVANFGCQ